MSRRSKSNRQVQSYVDALNRLLRFVSVPDLTRAIDEFLKACNENPKPFIWTATVEDIVQKIAGLEPNSSRSSSAPNRAHIYATPPCR